MEPTLDRSPEIAARPRRSWAILPDLLLVLIVMVAAALRLVGTNWDESQHLHPDERFLTMVETDIRLPDSLWQYFDTATSPLNPYNAGHGFFVYGTLPIFSVRLLAEWTGNTGYDQVTLLGRTTSAVFDLISVVLIYLIGARLYRRRVGLLAAASCRLHGPVHPARPLLRCRSLRQHVHPGRHLLRRAHPAGRSLAGLPPLRPGAGHGDGLEDQRRAVGRSDCSGEFGAVAGGG